MSLYLFLNSATQAVGPPCESPREMGLSGRLKAANRNDRHVSLPLSPRRRSSNFHPSSETSTLTRQMAMAHMRALSLTAYSDDAEGVVFPGRGAGDAGYIASTGRERATTMPNPPPSGSSGFGFGAPDIEVHHALLQPTHNHDPANSLWRTADPFRAPPPPWPNNRNVDRDISALMATSPQRASPGTKDVGLPIFPIDPNGTFRHGDPGTKAAQGKLIRDWMADVERGMAERGGERAPAVRTPSARGRRAVSWCGDEMEDGGYDTDEESVDWEEDDENAFNHL